MRFTQTGPNIGTSLAPLDTFAENEKKMLSGDNNHELDNLLNLDAFNSLTAGLGAQGGLSLGENGGLEFDEKLKNGQNLNDLYNFLTSTNPTSSNTMGGSPLSLSRPLTFSDLSPNSSATPLNPFLSPYLASLFPSSESPFSSDSSSINQTIDPALLESFLNANGGTRGLENLAAQARGASPIAFSSPSSGGGEQGERSLSPIGEDEQEQSQSSEDPARKKKAPKGGRRASAASKSPKKKSINIEIPPPFVPSGLDADEDTKDFQMFDMDHSSDEEDGEIGEFQPATTIDASGSTIAIPAPFEPLEPPKRQKKKESKVSVAKLATSELHHTSATSKLPPVPDWIDKPPPEVYKQMSSKEKRQLRNKISARNFRHRRKEYITTLEDAIKARDLAISTLTTSLNEMKVENEELKTENTELKSKWEDLVQKTSSILSSSNSSTVTPSPPSASPPSIAQVGLGPPNSIVAALTSSGSYAAPRRVASPGLRSNGIEIPNMNKDIGVSGKRFGTLGNGGGSLPVHTTFVPELRIPEKSKELSSNFGGNMNMNPNLNGLSPLQSSLLPMLTAHLRGTGEVGKTDGKGVHDDFFGSNPYFLKPGDVEEYRSQLYSKLSNNLAMNLAMGVSGGRERDLNNFETGKIDEDENGHGHGEKVRPMPVPIGSGWKPAFFTSPSSQVNKKSNGNVSPPPAYSTLDHLDLATSQASTSSRSSLLASQEVKPPVLRPNIDTKKDVAGPGLLGKMMDSFWMAFSGQVGGGVGLGRNKEDDFGRMFPKRFENNKRTDDEIESLGKGLESLKVGPK